MKIKTMSLLIAGLASAPTVMAGSLTVANSNLSLAGGLSGAGLYSDATGTSNDTDAVVTDFLVELSSQAPVKGIGFIAGYGELLQPTVLNNVGMTAPASSSLQYGSVIVKPSDALSFEVGKLATKIGYEVANTYANPHVLLGALWSAQPVYYAGARANYTVGGVTVFAEVNEDASSGATHGYVVGASGAAAGVNYSLSYYDAKDARDILDLIVSGEVAGMTVAANLDYHKLEQAPAPGADDTALGLGVYVIPKFGDVSVPLRLEYLDDGTSGIYAGGVDKGYTVTITPTYNFSANTFVRAEVAYVSADNNVFTDHLGNPTDSKTSVALQAGFKF